MENTAKLHKTVFCYVGMGVYCMPPDQGEPTDEAFFLQLQKASRSQALVLLGDFNHRNIC